MVLRSKDKILQSILKQLSEETDAHANTQLILEEEKIKMAKSLKAQSKDIKLLTEENDHLKLSLKDSNFAHEQLNETIAGMKEERSLLKSSMNQSNFDTDSLKVIEQLSNDNAALEQQCMKLRNDGDEVANTLAELTAEHALQMGKMEGVLKSNNYEQVSSQHDRVQLCKIKFQRCRKRTPNSKIRLQILLILHQPKKFMISTPH